MTRFPVPSTPQRLLRILTTVVAAASLPNYVLAQAVLPVAPPIAPPKAAQPTDRDAPAEISAEQMTGRPDRELQLDTKVEIVRGNTTITADHAKYHIVEDEVDADGNVRMTRSGDVYTGDQLKLNVDAGEGFVTHPTYKLLRNNGQGHADRINFEAEDRATVVDGTYSTCEGPDPDWYLRSSRLALDTSRDVGMARNTVVYFKGVPILGSPQMSFPLSDARKSGVLPPTVGATSKGGLEITVPYYFNIAPNRDLTVYPKIIAQRGLQLGASARYLDPSYAGETRIEALPSDREAHADRWAVSSIHTQTLTPGLTLNWNINAASDDNYRTDFANTMTGASQPLLLRDLNLTYSTAYWTAIARTTNYQVLQDPITPIARPYDRLPQLNFTAARPDVAGFDLALDSELTRFWHPTLQRGDRVYVNPKISYPIIAQGYFFTPKLSFHATRYNLDTVANPGDNNTPSRALPTASLDGGMVFERDAKFFGKAMTQTLEPRLFYVYTPYRDQSALPNFDSGVADLSFAQLFSENRFVGNDRISDANQITAAVTSRFIEPSGIERARVAIGQRYYFAQPQVTLGTAITDSRSDLLLSASGMLSQSFYAETNMQYSQSQHQLDRANYGVRYQPGPMKVLNLQYRQDLANDLEKSVDVSTQWPFAQRWYGVGRINYSIKTRKIAEGLLGMEYKADCWIFRIVAQRIPTATLQATTSLFFQLELNGLSKLGSNPLAALRSSVPGYQNINQTNTRP
ncbi:LPS-assembly protein [Actimicrobium sp. GrIS 1.19]|uniref:LPS-assembly protein LptD n=1 Tax=Actimicrobium sp. GrIS 1.19 TaxID=3071708 RepID=UPI002E003066|nr:LPS-assembly protein [Actimicrobium sp. GrIS 1.19]